jgi:hypothetical protein
LRNDEADSFYIAGPGKGVLPPSPDPIPKTNNNSKTKSNNKTKTKNKLKVVYTEDLTHPGTRSPALCRARVR